jgi:hypothetical protein
MKQYSENQIAKFMQAASLNFNTKFLPPSLMKQVDMEVAPPGWEPTVNAMKDKSGVDNPYALSWWMHNRGIAPKKKASESEESEDAKFDRQSPPKGYPKKSAHYADPKNFKYPIDTEKHVRAAISYFSKPDNRKGYTSDEVKTIWGRINRAADKFGIERSTDDSKEAVSFSSFGQLQRPQTNGAANRRKLGVRNNMPPTIGKFESDRELSWQTPLREAKIKDPAKREVEVIIMSEGLGNKKDMHYYSQDCIKKASPLFEGAKCFVDHPSETEEITRPERTVRDLVGYYTDVHPTEDGKVLMATLKLEDTDAGKLWFDKIKEAIDYSQRYPDKVYFAISINADGKTHEEDRNGEQINVVDEITEVDSADLVTKPALQTKFVRLLQSMREAAKSKNERRMYAMARKTMQAIAAEAKRLMKTASETESGETQKIGDLAKSLGQLHKAIAPHDQLIGSEAREHLKKAADMCKTAEDEHDMDGVFDHLKGFVKGLKPKDDSGDDGDDDKNESEREAESEDEDEDEGKKKSSESKRKKASEDEDEDEAFRHAKRAAEAEEGEDEDEEESTREAKHKATEARLKKAYNKLTKAAKMAMGEDNGKQEWSGLVKDAHDDLYPEQKMGVNVKREAEAEDEGRRKKESARATERAMNSLRETSGGKLASRSKLEGFVERQVSKLMRQADEGKLIEEQAKTNAKVLMRKANALLSESSIPTPAYPLIFDRLLECDSEREMVRIIEAQEAVIAAAGNAFALPGFKTKVEGAGSRMELRESDKEDESWLDGVVEELA